MPVPIEKSRRLSIIDDDLMSREVLTLLGADAGFDVVAFTTGEAALERFGASGEPFPDVVLADMQMPGVAGDELAQRLRNACGAATRLLAMSGSPVVPERIPSFNGFLLKPFSMNDVIAKLDQVEVVQPDAADSENYSGALRRSIYDSFAKGMPREQLRKLYAMSIDDADARIELMRKALEAEDADAYRREAHSIKGGCGLVGAVELAGLASAMEELGPQTVDNIGPLKQFLVASARLRRILDALDQ